MTYVYHYYARINHGIGDEEIKELDRVIELPFEINTLGQYDRFKQMISVGYIYPTVQILSLTKLS